MIKTAAAALSALAVTASAGAALAGDITGLWASPSDNGRIRISECGQGVCGRLVDADQIRANPNETDRYNRNEALRSRKVKGLMLFKGYTGGPSVWEGGQIYDPKSGRTGAKGELKLEGDTLKVKGCLNSFLCSSQEWKRVG